MLSILFVGCDKKQVEENKETITQVQEDIEENMDKETNEEEFDYKESYEDLKIVYEELSTKHVELENKYNKLYKEYEKLDSYDDGKIVGSVLGKEKSTVYLTFDDGPSENTEKILDILKENNINATFFPIYKQKSEKIYKRIVAEGHSLGNHTYSHDYSKIYTNLDNFAEEVKKLDNELYNITGTKPKLFRFPGGSNSGMASQYGGNNIMDYLTEYMANEKIYFDWNVDSNDAKKVTNDKDIIVNSVLEGCKGKEKAIVLMHDAAPKTTTVEALPDIIKGLKEQGFKFDRLTEETDPIQFN